MKEGARSGEQTINLFCLIKPDSSKAIDPVKRYLHFEKAYEAGELDKNFELLSVWELRFVVSATERDEVLAWGCELTLEAYSQDVAEKYCFYSYGDCMLIL